MSGASDHIAFKFQGVQLQMIEPDFTTLCAPCRLMIQKYGFQHTFLITAGLRTLSFLPIVPLLVNACSRVVHGAHIGTIFAYENMLFKVALACTLLVFRSRRVPARQHVKTRCQLTVCGGKLWSLMPAA